MNRKIVAARDEIQERYADRMAGARLAERDAATALQVAENAAVKPHEWDGKRVVRDEHRGTEWGRSLGIGKNAFRGVVFTYKHGDDLGNVRSYNLPHPGTAMVRLLKKDGTVGKKVQKLNLSNPVEAWRLDTPDTPA